MILSKMISEEMDVGLPWWSFDIYIRYIDRPLCARSPPIRREIVYPFHFSLLNPFQIGEY